jgi:site-specific DNA-methyltransferase (adenine-specific)
MRQVPDRSIHLVVTSPPYWQLKDYGSAEQIGFDHSYQDYINNLNLVWLECRRVLHDGCRLCVNIGDQFARAAYYGRYKVISIRTEIIRFCETIGFDFMGAIVWQKVTTCNSSGGGAVMGSFPHPRNGIVKLDYEHILLFKKHGAMPVVTAGQKSQSKMTTEEWKTYFSGHWQFPGEKQNGHLAMFPEELPRRLIRMFSFVDETVLDPFAGSATTLLAALHNDRCGIGYEINEDFRPIIQKRLEQVSDLAFLVDSSRPDAAAFESLPYLFEDPLTLDKQADPRTRRFGSRVSAHDPDPDEASVKVTEVLSPTEVRLDNNTTVALGGIKVPESQTERAVDFLNRTVRGRQVLLRHEGQTASHAVYLYLKNRTFVNARLVREGLAVLDLSKGTSNRALLKLRREAESANPVTTGTE